MTGVGKIGAVVVAEDGHDVHALGAGFGVVVESCVDQAVVKVIPPHRMVITESLSFPEKNRGIGVVPRELRWDGDRYPQRVGAFHL